MLHVKMTHCNCSEQDITELKSLAERAKQGGLVAL